MKHESLAVVLLYFSLTGCSSVSEKYRKPESSAGDMPAWNGRLDGAISAADLDPAILAEWWKTLEDPELNSLIDRAIAANLDLRTAQAQLRRARAERNIAQANRSPSVGVGGSATRSGTTEDASSLYSASLDATWELDVFGGLARGVEAAEADLQAAEEVRRDVLVTVLAEVALNYADLRTLQRRRTIAQDNLESQQRYLSILMAQKQEGAATQLEVNRAEANVATTRSAIPSLEQQLSETKNRLAVLIGRNPGELNAELEAVSKLAVPQARVAVGVPAQVLRRRPDVRAAERRLAAETARVGVAVADLYPKFALKGSIGLESLSLESLFKTASGVFGFGPSAQWNAYDGGRTRERIEVQSALQEEALIDYDRAILTALEDVQNAVTAFTQEQLRNHSLEVAAKSEANAAKLATARYDAGVTDFLSVLDAQRSRLGAEDELARSNGAILSNLIRIYKALGGGWTPEPSKAEKRG